MKKLTPFQILDKIEELAGRKVEKVSFPHAPKLRHQSINNWRTTIINFGFANKTYEGGAEICFHFEDGSFVHIGF